jgi:DNA replication protein DnaC
MERHEILEAMSELKLYGMRASFDEVAGKGLTRRDEIYPLIASLIRAERTHRQARSISYRIGGAKFPVLKDLDTFVFGDTPVDEGQVRELATGAFLDAKRNAIFIGGTGTGKTHLCIAVASAVIRTRARGRFFNLVDLVNQLEQEKAAGQATSNSAWSHWLTGRQSTIWSELKSACLTIAPAICALTRHPPHQLIVKSPGGI